MTAIDDVLAERSDTATYALLGRLAAEAGSRLELPSRRVVVLSSFTVEPLLPSLDTELFRRGWRASFDVISYGQWQQALLVAGVIDEDADDVFVLLHVDDVAPALAQRFLQDRADAEAQIAAVLDVLADGVKAFRSRAHATVHVASFTTTMREPERYWGHRAEDNRRVRIEEANVELAERLADVPDVHVYPYAAFVGEHGRSRFFDRVRDVAARAPIAPRAYPALAADLARWFTGVWTPRRKVVALDLDGTLWGGVLGEDGVDGIVLGDDGPGRAYRDLQVFLRELSATGVLLVLTSKNDEALVREAFETHPSMVLRWEDFAAVRVSWGDKPTAVQDMAAELSLGIDSFVFLDDSDVECARMRAELPEVQVVQAIAPIEDVPELLLRGAQLEAPWLGEDDLERGDRYRAERVRRVARSEHMTEQEFLASLSLRLSVRRSTPAELPRLAQLAGKTNQFNSTTIRYDEADLAQMLEDPAHLVLSISLADRFGDYGITGLVVARRAGSDLVVESFLLSCRVLGRRVEEAVVALLDGHAAASGLTDLAVLHVPTARNGQVAALLGRLAFTSSNAPGAPWRRVTGGEGAQDVLALFDIDCDVAIDVVHHGEMHDGGRA